MARDKIQPEEIGGSDGVIAADQAEPEFLLRAWRSWLAGDCERMHPSSPQPRITTALKSAADTGTRLVPLAQRLGEMASVLF